MGELPEPCGHSMMVPDCASCWIGAYNRAVAYADRLRGLITDHGGRWLNDALVAHDEQWFGSNPPPAPAPLGGKEGERT